jgi:hypothetical protein
MYEGQGRIHACVCGYLWTKGQEAVSTVFGENDGRLIVTGPFDAEMPDHYVIIKDYRWWAANEREIYAWMRQCLPNGTAHHQGMVVTLKEEQDVLNFLLRWQG